MRHFTLVFEGSIRDIPFNPLKAETAFGIPVAAGVGDAFESVNELEERLKVAKIEIERLRSLNESLCDDNERLIRRMMQMQAAA